MLLHNPDKSPAAHWLRGKGASPRLSGDIINGMARSSLVQVDGRDDDYHSLTTIRLLPRGKRITGDYQPEIRAVK